MRSAEALQDVPRPIVAWAGRYNNGDEIPPHTHPRAQLLYAVEGVMRVLTPTSVWTIPSQRALWVPANVEHHSFMMSDLEMRTLYVSADVPVALGQECRAISVSNFLRELILGLLEEPAEYPVAGRGEHIAALILMEINRAATHAVEIPWPQDRRLQTVCHSIMSAPGVNRTIEELADAAGASARTLIRLFPKETGLKYRQWVQQVQIADAICRLGRGESIARISNALGYASPSAFSAMFKRTFGVAPNQYFQSPHPSPDCAPRSEEEGAKSIDFEISTLPNPLPLSSPPQLT
ncbi:MAG: AraC family transcriptional regulator [Gammaproteobacteria bacterium]|nr:MAG: AraC family transcriptional regulator [Gammaproteobacteria bacterium]